MPIKKHIICLLALLLFSSLAFCQSPDMKSIAEDELLQPAELLGQELKGYGNETYIQQSGNRNDIHICQVLTSDGNNLIYASQEGNRNMAKINQIGKDNQLALIQRGLHNSFELDNRADFNKTVAIQEGSNNQIVQRLINSNQINSEFIQQGNDNKIIQELYGVDGNKLKVHQTGDRQQVIIRQSAF